MESLFQYKLKEACQRADELLAPTPLPQERRFNVHKRSLPPCIDTPVIFGVSKETANRMIGSVLKSKVCTDTKTLIYYDIVPIDATLKERGIYFNDRPVTKEEL